MAYDLTKDRYQMPSAAGGPAGRADVVTPDDDDDVTNYFTGLYVGVSGNLTVTPMRNSSDAGVLFSNVPIGWFPVAVRRVWATGTTAASIVGVRD